MDYSLILPIAVSLVGLFLLIKLRFFFLIHPIRTARELITSLADRDSRRAFLLAMAGTLGVGNIFGVAAGIMIGGAGSLFWLFISSFFAMIIKYAETLLVFDRGVRGGGMATVIEGVFGRLGRAFSLLYTSLMLLLSLFMGSAMQTSALCDVAGKSLQVSPFFCAGFLVILLTPCLIGGGKKIENITEIVIPLTTIIYIILCFTVIFINFSRLPSVISSVISSAFTFRSAVGGGISFLAVREGFARGILSNEAGVGTSAMAHSRSLGRTPHRAGLFAMCEVVFDSSLLCILTGIAILISTPDPTAFDTPMALIVHTFSSVLGDLSGFVLTLIILCFAYATLICWYYYGSRCATSLGRISGALFPLLFIASILLSSAMSHSFLLYVIDLILLLMSLLTLYCIVRRSGRILTLCQIKNPE